MPNYLTIRLTDWRCCVLLNDLKVIAEIAQLGAAGLVAFIALKFLSMQSMIANKFLKMQSEMIETSNTKWREFVASSCKANQVILVEQIKELANQIALLSRAVDRLYDRIFAGGIEDVKRH